MEIDTQELASGEKWALTKENDTLLLLQLHSVYGTVEIKATGGEPFGLMLSIRRVYEDLKASGPIEKTNADLYTKEDLNACLNRMTTLAEGYSDETQKYKDQINAVRGAIIGALTGGHLEGPESGSYGKWVIHTIADLLDIQLLQETREVAR